MKKRKTKKNDENEITLDFNVTQKGKNAGAHSVFEKRSKRYKKKDVKINAVKRENKHIISIILVSIILVVGIFALSKTLDKKENTTYVPPLIDEPDIDIENDTNIEEEKPEPQEIVVDLESKEAAKLTEFIKGITIDEEYDNIASIKNSNKIKIIVNKTGLEEGYYNIANQKATGVKVEDFNKKAKEIFGETVEVEHATTREFEYNPKEEIYTKIPSQHSGYKELEYITDCKKLENIYTVNIAYAQGYLTDHTYVISGNIEEIEVKIATSSTLDDAELIKEIKVHRDKLEKYQYQIKENIDGTLSIISFKKI